MRLDSRKKLAPYNTPELLRTPLLLRRRVNIVGDASWRHKGTCRRWMKLRHKRFRWGHERCTKVAVPAPCRLAIRSPRWWYPGDASVHERNE